MKPTNEEYDYEDCRPPTGKLNDHDKAFVERLKKAKNDEKLVQNTGNIEKEKE